MGTGIKASEGMCAEPFGENRDTNGGVWRAHDDGGFLLNVGSVRPHQIPLLVSFISSRRRHASYWRDWSSDVCSSDLGAHGLGSLHRIRRQRVRVLNQRVPGGSRIERSYAHLALIPCKTIVGVHDLARADCPTMKKSFDRFQLNGDDPHPTTLDDDPATDRANSVHADTGAASSPLLPGRPVRGLKTTVAFGTVIGAAGLGLWAYSNFTATPVRPAVLPPPSVAVAMPVQANVADWTDLTGQFSAVNQVVLRAQVSGYLTEIHFKDGQIVHKGDLLFVIDPRPYEIQLEQANAQFQTASTTLALANKQLERTARLNRVAVESDEHLDESTQSQRVAAAAVKAAEAAIHGAQLNIEFTHIVAP